MFSLFNFEFYLTQWHAALRCTKNWMVHVLVPSLLEQAWDGLRLLTDVKHLELAYLKFTQQQKIMILIILG